MNVTPTAASAERNWKRHALIQIKLRNRLSEKNMKNLVHVSSALTLQKKQNQELTNRISDLSKFTFNVIHGRDEQSPDGTHMDQVDSQLMMELVDSGQFDVDTATGDLEMSCDIIEDDGE